MSFKTYAFSINTIPTDIAFCNFENNLVVIVSQFRKPGNWIYVKKDLVDFIPGGEQCFRLSTLFGQDNSKVLSLVRVLAENIGIPKKAIFSLTLKDESLSTLKTLISIINKIKSW